MKVQEVLEKTTKFFKDKGIETSRLDAELLLSASLNWKRIDLYLKHDYPMQEIELTKCREAVKRRANGEPVAYILGKKDFFNLSFKVNKDVLIPRPETELLVEEALAWAKKQDKTQFRILDMGCGSGCIGLSILKNLPESRLFSIDISAEALKVAQENAQNLDLADRTEFVEMDAAQISQKEFDIIVANPPYIAHNDSLVQESVKAFEPHLALYADEKGLAKIRSWSQAASQITIRPGICLFEIGYDQGQNAKEIFQNHKSFDEISVVKDLAQYDRVVKAIKL